MNIITWLSVSLPLAILFIVYDIALSIILLFVPRQLRMKNIKGQTVLITGAGNGIGRQLAIEFSKHNVCLVLVDLSEEGLLETKKLLDPSSKAFTYVCDVSRRNMVYEMAERIREDIGDVDILVNNAGIVQGKYLMDIPDERIQKTVEVNALAHFWTCKAFLPAMMHRNRGHLVSITSVAGKVGGPKLTDYTCSKFAANGFAESLAAELYEKGLHGIKVSIVYPWFISTGLFDGVNPTMFPFLSPEFVGREIVARILLEENDIYLPSSLKPLLTVNAILPRWIQLAVFSVSGLLKVNNSFIGRIEEKSTNGHIAVNGHTGDQRKKSL